MTNETLLAFAGDYSLINSDGSIFIRKVTTRAGDKIRGIVARWDETQDTGALDNAEAILALSSDELEEGLADAYDLWALSAQACDNCAYLTDDAYIRSHGNYCSYSCAGSA